MVGAKHLNCCWGNDNNAVSTDGVIGVRDVLLHDEAQLRSSKQIIPDRLSMRSLGGCGEVSGVAHHDHKKQR